MIFVMQGLFRWSLPAMPRLLFTDVAGQQEKGIKVSLTEFDM